MMLKHAIEYFRRGFRVVPVKLPEKKPIVKWEKYIEHQTEEDIRLLPWYLANGIAIVSGVRIDNKYICVIDFDRPEAYDRVKHILPDTYTERTPRGGYHIFLFSEEEPKTRSFRDENNKEIFSLLGCRKLCVVYPSEGYEIINDAEIATVRNVNALVNKIAFELGLLRVEKFDDTPKNKLLELFEQVRPYLNIAKEYPNYFTVHCPFHPPDEHPSFAIYKNTFLAIDFHDNKVYTLKELAKALGVKLREEPKLNTALIKTMNTKERANYLAKYLMSKIKFAEVVYSGNEVELWYFNSKILTPNARRVINKELRRLIGDLVSRNVVNEVEDAILGLTDWSFKRSELDPIRYLPFRNCILDLETLEIKDYEELAEDGVAFTYYLDFELDIELFDKIKRGEVKPEDIALEFDRFINRFYDKDNKRKLLYVLATTLLPKVQKKKVGLVIGEPDTGKTTLKEVLLKVFGSMAATSSLMLLKRTHFSLLSLVGKRLILVSEKPDYLNSELFKQLTGGETMIIDVKHRPTFEAPIYATWLFFMNDPPVFDKVDEAVVGRIVIINTKDPLSEDEKDPTIFDRLIAEKNKIFYYILYYYYLLSQGTLIISEDPESVYSTLLKAYSNVFEFVQQECELGESFEIEGKKLYEAYIKWCAEKTLKAVGKQTFYSHIELYLAKENIGCRITKGRGHVWFKGIKLKDEGYESFDLSEVLE